MPVLSGLSGFSGLSGLSGITGKAGNTAITQKKIAGQSEKKSRLSGNHHDLLNAIPQELQDIDSILIALG